MVRHDEKIDSLMVTTRVMLGFRLRDGKADVVAY